MQARTPGSGDSYRWYALGVLTLVYTIHAMDRFVLQVLIEPIKREFGASDAAMGFLAGLAYTVAFSIAVLPVGYLIDRFNRRNLLAGILSVWSVLTAVCGLASSYFTLLLARMGVGAAEAGASPAALSMISDYFAPRERGRAIGAYYLSTGLGIGIGMVGGGWVAAHYGWRVAFFIAGIPGLLMAAVALATLREPRRGAADEGADAPAQAPAVAMGPALRYIFAQPALVHLLMSIMLASFVSVAAMTWTVSFFMREHGLDLARAGVYIGLGIAVFQSIGSLAAGYVADRYAGDVVARRALVPAAMCLATVPLGLGMAFAGDWRLAFALMCANALLLGAWTSPAYSFALGLVPAHMRGMTMSTCQLATNLLGSGLGPLVSGWLSDAIGGPHALARALAICFLVNLWSAAHFILAARAARPAA
ncbi:MAG: MFS transporter [Gammaproteobacteria bacterium]